MNIIELWMNLAAQLVVMLVVAMEWLGYNTVEIGAATNVIREVIGLPQPW